MIPKIRIIRNVATRKTGTFRGEVIDFSRCEVSCSTVKHHESRVPRFPAVPLIIHKDLPENSLRQKCRVRLTPAQGVEFPPGRQVPRIIVWR